MEVNEQKKTSTTEYLKNRLQELYKRKLPPQSAEFLEVLEKANTVLENENELLRPYDASGRPGGILVLKKDIPTIIVPDLHARRDFIINLMFFTNDQGEAVIDQLADGKIQVVCVGDGLHSEAQAIKRWIAAFEEYQSGFKKHKHMDEEMRDGFGLMEMIQEIKIAFPEHFHFLKGNHENIANEQGQGNYPFRKFAYEGSMVLDYVKAFYSEDFFSEYYRFEKNLPLFAVGNNFAISHAEPLTFYYIDSLLEYREHPEVVEGLTWTDNNSAEQDSVKRMLDYYVESANRGGSYYFGGHRAINTLYKQRAEGEYVQIHNPKKFVIAFIKEEGPIDLETDIKEIPKMI